jgi:molecular chaperone GrpE
MKTETEYVMMKKKAKEQQELKDEVPNKPTENKEYSYNPDNNTDKYQADSVSSESEGSAADGTGTVTGTSDKVLSDGKTPEEKLAEMQDKYIRLSAEFDNYRKRTLREKMDLSKYAAEDLFRNIIPLMDDFDRALAHMDTATDCTAMKDGIDLIYNKFSAFFKQNGIKEIESMNLGFNVDLHEAIAKIPVQEEEKKGKVVDVVQKGYYIYDKVLRHSKVVVGE